MGRCGKEKKRADTLNYLKQDSFGDEVGEDTQKKSKMKGS